MQTITLHPRRPVAVALGVAAAVAATAVGAYKAGHAETAGRASAAAASAAAPLALPDLSKIAQQHGAAVVNVSISGTRKAGLDDGDTTRRRRPWCRCAAKARASS